MCDANGEIVMIFAKAVVALLLLPVSAVTYAADNSVFGLQLGQPLGIPECVKDIGGYPGVTDKICFERLAPRQHETGPVVSDTIRIRFPMLSLPSYVNGSAIIGQVLNGRLEGTGFNTHGVLDQDVALDALKEKYGAPDTYSPTTVQNGMGATFKVFVATWQTADVVVTFRSTTGKTNSGLVNIDTKLGNEWRAARLKELMGGGRKL